MHSHDEVVCSDVHLLIFLPLQIGNNAIKNHEATSGSSFQAKRSGVLSRVMKNTNTDSLFLDARTKNHEAVSAFQLEPQMKLDNLRIGELAKRTNSTVETIRFYEQEGLLPAPSRTDSNYRIYGIDHLERLSLIRHCRSLDMGLDEIRTLLKFRDAPEDNCDDVNALLDAHIDHVTSRITVLRELEDQLKGLRHLCNAQNKAKHCAILKDLSVEATATTCGNCRTTTSASSDDEKIAKGVRTDNV